MKIDCFKAKVTSLLLVFLILLQSCVVYKDVSSTFDEAVVSNCKVLIVMADGKEFKFTKVEKIGNVYYGILKTKKGVEKILLIEKDIKEVKVLDKRLSTWGNVGIIVGSLGIISVIVGSLVGGTDSD
ncbi:hypothetical protein [Flavobacterium gilvum]|uniref:Lipoprotein n=1 Tax=Flavobacterium gilvum TaxID=1492737 RepID=A0AAC9I2U0_9FLAO|nr:hypothetical protein [Flavobacterium gilvum]AOW08377.1 hypothetical protein EM308_02015 [Flavobacterium gilvum]